MPEYFRNGKAYPLNEIATAYPDTFDRTSFTYMRTSGKDVLFACSPGKSFEPSDIFVYVSASKFRDAGRPETFTGAQAREYGWAPKKSDK